MQRKRGHVGKLPNPFLRNFPNAVSLLIKTITWRLKPTAYQANDGWNVDAVSSRITNKKTEETTLSRMEVIQRPVTYSSAGAVLFYADSQY